jgi:hypothetical protein
MMLGVDRDSAQLAHIYDERHEAVKRPIADLIAAAHKKGRKVGICGQAPSDYPDFAVFLKEQGIDSISVNPDAVMKVIEVLAGAGDTPPERGETVAAEPAPAEAGATKQAARPWRRSPAPPKSRLFGREATEEPRETGSPRCSPTPTWRGRAQDRPRKQAAWPLPEGQEVGQATDLSGCKCSRGHGG